MLLVPVKSAPALDFIIFPVSACRFVPLPESINYARFGTKGQPGLR